jgi:sigma-B regulation protein RsbU (phosphoserine phosphatase)
MFVTAFCGFLDLRSGVVRYSNAGHDRPLIVVHGKAVRPLVSKSGLPLGVLPNFTYAVEELALEPGESLFLYTDGVTEAANRAEELFTIERLREVLERRTAETPADLIRSVVESVDRFAGPTPQADDITMLCIQYRHPPMQQFATFERDIRDLEKVFAFVGGFVNDRSVDLAVEEIFTNFVRHNAGGKGVIEIRMERQDSGVSITLTDPDCPPFDIGPDPDINAPLEERNPGGLGLYLTRKMMDRVDYTHDNGVGTVTLFKRVG